MGCFARYDSNAIKVNRKRKRAIAKQKAKTRSKVIEIGDMVEVVAGDDEYVAAHPVGTVGYVVAYDDRMFSPDCASVSTRKEGTEDSLCSRYHNSENLKLIKKGTKQHG